MDDARAQLNASLSRIAAMLEAILAEVRQLEGRLAHPAPARLMDGVPVGVQPAAPARLMSVRDLADRVGVQERTIRRWRADGLLPAGISIGGIVRWRPESIEAWLADRGRAR